VEIQKPAAGGPGGGLSGGHVIWTTPTPIGRWFTVVLGIKQSYDPKAPPAAPSPSPPASSATSASPATTAPPRPSRT